MFTGLLSRPLRSYSEKSYKLKYKQVLDVHNVLSSSSSISSELESYSMSKKKSEVLDRNVLKFLQEVPLLTEFKLLKKVHCIY